MLHARLRDDAEGCAYDQQSSSIIRLNNGTILYLREVNRSDSSLSIATPPDVVSAVVYGT